MEDLKEWLTKNSEEQKRGYMWQSEEQRLNHVIVGLWDYIRLLERQIHELKNHAGSDAT